MKRLLVIFLILFAISICLPLFLLFVATNKSDDRAQHPDVDFTTSCVDCHSVVTAEIVEGWRQSKHGEHGHGCEMCHGVSMNDFQPKGALRCRRCHEKQRMLISRTSARTCFDCHDGHTLSFHR